VSTLTTTALGTNSGELSLYVYKSETIPLVWDEMEALLLPGFESAGGMVTSADVYKWLVNRDAVAFATVRDEKIVAVIVVTKVNYSTYSAARIVACAGKGLKEAAKFLDALEAWAFTQGCVEIEGWCSKSMARLARRCGWEEKLTMIYRDIRRKLQ